MWKTYRWRKGHFSKCVNEKRPHLFSSFLAEERYIWSKHRALEERLLNQRRGRRESDQMNDWVTYQDYLRVNHPCLNLVFFVTMIDQEYRRFCLHALEHMYIETKKILFSLALLLATLVSLLLVAGQSIICVRFYCLDLTWPFCQRSRRGDEVSRLLVIFGRLHVTFSSSVQCVWQQMRNDCWTMQWQQMTRWFLARGQWYRTRH